MKLSPMVWAGLAAGVAVLLSPVVFSPSVQRVARSVVPTPKPDPKTVPPGLVPFVALFDASAKRNAVPRDLLFAISLQETRNSDPRAFRQEPVPAWIAESKVLDSARAKGWTNQQLSASYGLMQVLGATAWGQAWRGTPSGLFEPRVSIELGARYMGSLLKKYKSSNLSADGVLYLALIAYNGGHTAVSKVQAGQPQPQATAYAAAVLRRLEAIKRHWKGAIDT